jgi:hypothetical protein
MELVMKLRSVLSCCRGYASTIYGSATFLIALTAAWIYTPYGDEVLLLAVSILKSVRAMF